MRFAFALLTLGGLLAGPAMAQTTHDPLNGDNYHIVEIDDGVLRIDRQSGEISECRESQNGWICRLTADDRLAYEAEINRLDAEVDRLEEALLAAQQALETGERDLSLVPDGAPDRNEPSVRERLDLPTDDELDAVMDTAEEVMRRFFGMVRDLREDLEAERAP